MAGHGEDPSASPNNPSGEDTSTRRRHCGTEQGDMCPAESDRSGLPHIPQVAHRRIRTQENAEINASKS